MPTTTDDPLPGLIRTLRSRTATERIRASKDLGRLGSLARDALPTLVGLLRDDDAKVREHIKQYGHTFPVLMDRDNKVANQFGVFGLPVSVFVDEKGIVQEYIKGGLLTEQKIQAIVHRLQAQATVNAVSLK